ncbi:MAG: rRNA maturation RNase YbeY [Candidatus Omnitrophota bacterium]
MTITRTTRKILNALGFDGARVDIVLCGDDFIRALNLKYRDLNRATNVLSFPQENMDEGAFLNETPAVKSWFARFGKTLSEPGTVGKNPLILGDIVISTDAISRDASRRNVPETEELQKNIIHGILHLLGWDHMNKRERDRMRKLEKKLFEKVSGKGAGK